jgi:hypothetical protein
LTPAARPAALPRRQPGKVTRTARSSPAELAYALIRSATIGWAASATIAGLLGAAVLLLAFILNEARATAPLMPLRIFTVPRLAAGNGVVLLAFGAVFSVFSPSASTCKRSSATWPPTARPRGRNVT